MKTHPKNKSLLIPAMLSLPAIILILTGCSSFHPDLILDSAVGPQANRGGHRAGNGTLVVYSSVEPSPFVENPFFYHYTYYKVCDASGRPIKEVPSTKEDIDPAPARVGLTPGAYRILAHSPKYGIVSVPVVIQEGRTTSVYLDGTARSEMNSVTSTGTVTLPDGEFVGWKSGS